MSHTSEKLDRLTEEQVAEALKHALHWHGNPNLADVPLSDSLGSMAAALLQVSADLSVVKEQIQSRHQWRSRMGLTVESDAAKLAEQLATLQKAARDVDTAGRALAQRIDAEGGHGPKVHDLNSALFEKLISLRSLLPEEER